MPQIRPITDLRNTNEISNLCNAKREPIFITKNGYGDMVVTQGRRPGKHAAVRYRYGHVIYFNNFG